MYRYKNNISVFTLCYTSLLSIYTHLFINGAFIYSAYISAAVVLRYSRFFVGCFFPAVGDRPLIQRPSLDRSRSRLHALSCDLRASTFRLGSCRRDHRRPTGAVPRVFLLLSFKMGEVVGRATPPTEQLLRTTVRAGLFAELDVIVQLWGKDERGER